MLVTFARDDLNHVSVDADVFSAFPTARSVRKPLLTNSAERRQQFIASDESALAVILKNYTQLNRIDKSMRGLTPSPASMPNGIDYTKKAIFGLLFFSCEDGETETND